MINRSIDNPLDKSTSTSISRQSGIHRYLRNKSKMSYFLILISNVGVSYVVGLIYIKMISYWRAFWIQNQLISYWYRYLVWYRIIAVEFTYFVRRERDPPADKGNTTYDAMRLQGWPETHEISGRKRDFSIFSVWWTQYSPTIRISYKMLVFGLSRLCH